MKKSTYEHITSKERDEIAVFQGMGLSLSEIGRRLQRDKSTISREFRRNGTGKRRIRYLGHTADVRAMERWNLTHRKERLKNDEIREYVDIHLRMRWSPQLVAGRIGIDKPGLSISHEAIYQYVYAEKRNLIECLEMKRWSRKRRGYSRKHHKVLIPNRKDISLRPAVVADRIEIGHWEADSAISRASKASLNVLAERVSRVTLITKLPRKTAEETSLAIVRRLKGLPAQWLKTITYDNGSENTEHDKTDAALKTESYFCAPYHSWEKGTVENTIGIIRRWLPKKTDLQKVPDDKIVEIENWLNNRPRKCLGYKTPWEVFKKQSVALAG